jgi:hypothetical protein
MHKVTSWIQMIILLGGLILIYGQQVQSVKDIERRTTKCEENLRDQNIARVELLNAISDLKIDIRELKTEIRYLRGGK